MKRIFSLLLIASVLLSSCALSVFPVAANTGETTVTDNPVTVENETTDGNAPADGQTEPEATEPEETQPEESEPEESEPEETQPDDGSLKASDDLIALLKYEEGFCKYPVWDYSQYTVGYGTRCPSDMLSEYMRRGITESEAELLLREHLVNTEWLINKHLIEKYGLSMTQWQFDALVTFSYNMGPGWITSPSQNIHQQVVNGAGGNAIIDALSRWCKAGGSVHSVLLRRRLSEARMYIEGIYAHSVPDTYCYVLYNGNGGSTTQSAQGYNPNLPGAVPKCVATYGTNTFAGWYTSPTGGEKVEILTQALRGKTLYAHWAEVEPEKPEELENPVTVKVTADEVNLRNGPGTNYPRIGSAKKGETYTITKILETSDYIWGYYGSGWICLQYTNYNKGEEPEPSEPEPSDPNETEPEVTEPKPTQPDETEPEEKPVTGKITANPYLCVRQGPGTGYKVVDTLQPGEKVTILQQKAVGSSIWGKISNGWISMNYVDLDRTAEPGNNPGNGSSGSGKTGTITCELLNIRSGAGVNYGIVGQYKKNDSVTITDQKTVGSTTWGKTAKGWVSMDYVKLSSTGSGDSGSNPGDISQGGSNQGGSSTQITGTVISNDVLRIRSGAGTSYGVVGFLDPGAKITILEKKVVGNTTWGKIAKGWVSMDYVKVDSTGGTSGDDLPPDIFDEEEQSIKTVTASCLCVRSGAGTGYAVVSYLYKGSKVTVTETKNVGSSVWGKIANGWICLDYTK